MSLQPTFFVVFISDLKQTNYSLSRAEMSSAMRSVNTPLT
jgi:hypothetical protein